MEKHALFSAVVGTAWTADDFTVYTDLSFLWKDRVEQSTGNKASGALQTCLKRAQEEARKHITKANIQEWSWNPEGAS